MRNGIEKKKSAESESGTHFLGMGKQKKENIRKFGNNLCENHSSKDRIRKNLTLGKEWYLTGC